MKERGILRMYFELLTLDHSVERMLGLADPEALAVCMIELDAVVKAVVGLRASIEYEGIYEDMRRSLNEIDMG